MYCPQCGQRQVSSEMRFCSRCGFPMGGVAELLAQGGVLGVGEEGKQEQQGISPRRKGVRQGVMMMLLGSVIVPILAILDSFADGPSILDLLVPIAAVICFAGGMMRILYALLFEQNTPEIKRDAPAYVPSAMPAQLDSVRTSALPPAQSVPVPNFAPRRANTAELVQPQSVTENTTRLLDEDKNTRGQ
jgi:hypothetical protein